MRPNDRQTKAPYYCRCYAALGDIPKTHFLNETLKIAEDFAKINGNQFYKNLKKIVYNHFIYLLIIIIIFPAFDLLPLKELFIFP